MRQLENSGILNRIEELFDTSNNESTSQNRDSGDPMMQMKICIKASERLSGVIDRVQRFVANSVYPLFPELESLVYSKKQFIECLNRMIHCVNPDNIDLGGHFNLRGYFGQSLDHAGDSGLQGVSFARSRRQ